uniref:Uncharacterized protein n=1 Tax=Octopus bimaculoides TaxID=37653 RepID=A0A0L8ICH3_OCTBM
MLCRWQLQERRRKTVTMNIDGTKMLLRLLLPVLEGMKHDMPFYKAGMPLQHLLLALERMKDDVTFNEAGTPLQHLLLVLERMKDNVPFNKAGMLLQQPLLAFKKMKDDVYTLETTTDPNFSVVMHADRRSSGAHVGRFNAPTCYEIVAVTCGEQLNKRDILKYRNSRLQRINKTHRSYDALYEDGYHFGIPQHSAGNGEAHLSKTVTYMDFYAFQFMMNLHPTMNGEADDIVESFKKFKQKTQLAFKSFLKGATADEKVSYILLWTGEKGLDLFNSWDMSESDCNNPDILLKKFERHLEPRSNH